MSGKKALITGMTGQDGSYLVELLLGKGYEVHGLVLAAEMEDARDRFGRLEGVVLHEGRLEKASPLLEIFARENPDECYHLGARTFVHEPFEEGFKTLETNIFGTLHVLSALFKESPECRFYFAGSAEMFGKVRDPIQSETTPFHPRSLYGISKVTGFDLTRHYRETHKVFACSGILFNHESPRRGPAFVTRKITRTVAEMKAGLKNVLVLGNLDAKRDWGFAGDYVEAMWMMLQHSEPDDYVIATGKTHTVREFVERACDRAGLKPEFVDLKGLSEAEADREVESLEQKAPKGFVVQHPRFYRPAEKGQLVGDSSHARDVLGWQPRMTFEALVGEMVDSDMAQIAGP